MYKEENVFIKEIKETKNIWTLQKDFQLYCSIMKDNSKNIFLWSSEKRVKNAIANCCDFESLTYLVIPLDSFNYSFINIIKDNDLEIAINWDGKTDKFLSITFDDFINYKLSI